MTYKSKITHEVIDQIVFMIRAGNFAKVACASAGISTDAMRRWDDRGAAELKRLEAIGSDDAEPLPDEAIFLRFHLELAQARAHAEAESVSRIKEIASGKIRNIDPETGEPDPNSWRLVDDRVALQAEMWYLERAFGERWNPKIEVKQEVSGTIDHSVTLRLALPVPAGMKDLAKITEAKTLGLAHDEDDPKIIDVESA